MSSEMSSLNVARCSSYRMLLQIFSLLFVLSFLSMLELQFVQADSRFTILGDQYVCDVNLICLGDAHIYKGNNNRYFDGGLSLSHKDDFEIDQYSAGIAYYPKPIRFLDPVTRTAASFSTSFQFYEAPTSVTPSNVGDGMAFVISGDNSTLGKGGATFGFFDPDGFTAFKSVAVEFDSFTNHWFMANDINNNHVSIDIHNVNAVVTRNASEVNIVFARLEPIFAWVDYSAETQILEVRISESAGRPSAAFINHTVNLFDAVDEYMWVGFAAGNGDNYSAYYVGNWTFEAAGIPARRIHAAISKKTWGTSVGIFAAVVAISAVVVALMASLVLILVHHRRTRAKVRGAYFRMTTIENDLDFSEPYRFSLEELREATNGFAEETKLGEGGFGCVYRGDLSVSNLKAPVAVKRISSESQQGEKEFRAEVSIISQLRHRNLIRLLGCCIGDGKYYIVYDLMSNGSLDKVLTPKYNGEPTTPLTWPQRIKILQGVASAVEYLHNGWNQRVIHRDIKASNVMLDDQWNAKLGDFGLARVAEHQSAPHTMTVAGTPGYMAPEIVSSRTYTEKTDVFSFGTLALEIACGRKSLALHARAQEMILVDWVWQKLSEGNLLSVVDRRLDQYDVKQMEKLLLLGLLCAHPDPSARPPMRIVVQVLNGDASVPAVPVEKPSTGFRISIDEYTSQSDAHSHVNTKISQSDVWTLPD